MPFKPLTDPFRRPLIGSGRMLARVIASHRAARITQNELIVEVTSVIAMLHNLGRKKRPQREFLGFAQTDLERAAERVAEHTVVELLNE